MRQLRYGLRLGLHLLRFASENRAYWMVPLLVVLALLSALLFLGEASTPFIYTLW